MYLFSPPLAVGYSEFSARVRKQHGLRTLEGREHACYSHVASVPGNLLYTSRLDSSKLANDTRAISKGGKRLNAIVDVTESIPDSVFQSLFIF